MTAIDPADVDMLVDAIRDEAAYGDADIAWLPEDSFKSAAEAALAALADRLLPRDAVHSVQPLHANGEPCHRQGRPETHLDCPLVEHTWTYRRQVQR